MSDLTHTIVDGLSGRKIPISYIDNDDGTYSLAVQLRGSLPMVVVGDAPEGAPMTSDGAGGATFAGDTLRLGSWRFALDGSDLVVECLVDAEWVEVQRFVAPEGAM